MMILTFFLVRLLRSLSPVTNEEPFGGSHAGCDLFVPDIFKSTTKMRQHNFISVLLLNNTNFLALIQQIYTWVSEILLFLIFLKIAVVSLLTKKIFLLSVHFYRFNFSEANRSIKCN